MSITIPQQQSTNTPDVVITDPLVTPEPSNGNKLVSVWLPIGLGIVAATISASYGIYIKKKRRFD